MNYRFLLAQLQLDSLIGKRSPKAIRATLQSLRKEAQANGRDTTKTIDSAYVLAMERIQGQLGDQCELGKQVLSWITCAKRPLKPSELQCALAVELDSTELDEENLPDLVDMLSVCAGLVTIDTVSDVVRLVHYTTQEFFERTWRTWFPEAPTEITNICVTYLLFDVFGQAQELETSSHVLYDYAARNWGIHARGGFGDRALIIRFLEDATKLAASVKGFSSLSAQSVTALHVTAFFGLGDITTELLDSGHDPNKFARLTRTPLSLASEKGFHDVVRVLLQAGAADPVGSYWCSPLWYAARNGHAAVVEDLLKTPLDVNQKETNRGETSLWKAVSENHVDVVELLTTHPQVDVDLRDDYYCATPLWEAASNGSKTITRLLLATGHVDVNAEDSYYGRTPLLLAARKGSVDVVRLLLADDSVDINISDRLHGTTPLWWAAANGHEEVVRFLLAKSGLALNTKDHYYKRTPLWEAAVNGHISIVKLLAADPRTDLDTRPSYL